MRKGFPKVITDMPEAEIPFDGVHGWIAQGENHQLVFFEIDPSAEVPEHSHEYAQWGVVLDGEMELTIDGETQVYGKGQDYIIPPHARHSAKSLSRVRVLDLFQEKTRYRTKNR